MADSLPPGLLGYRTAVEDAQRRNASSIQNAAGLLGLQNAIFEQQLNPLKLEQLQTSVNNAKLINQLKTQAIGGALGGIPPVSPMAFGQGGVSLPGGGQGNLQTGQVVPPQAQGGLANLTDSQIRNYLYSGDPGLMAAAKAALELQKPINVRPGGTVYIPGQGPQYTAPSPQGTQVTYGPQGPKMGILPGTVESQVALGQTPLERVINADQTISYVPKSQLATAAQNNPIPGAISIQIPSNVQAERDAEANRIKAAELQPNGGGMIPSSRVLPQSGPPRFGQTQEEQIAQAAETEGRKKFEAERSNLAINAPQARAAVADATTGLMRMESFARQIMNDPALNRVTGLMGAVPNLPGSQASDIDARLGALKSQVGFSVLQAMRDASKTGGALGAISDRENELLQRNLAALDKTQSLEGMKRSLQTIIDFAQGARERINRGYQDTYSRVVGTQGMQPTPQGAIPSQGQQVANDPLGIRGGR